jgi:acetyl-CoA carboxylase biotin carboxyl carrier protein
MQQIETAKKDRVEDKKLEEKKEFVITSPMVGRFLLSPSKDHPPFIVENAKVKQGQKIAVIETMRIFRDVISPKNGVVKKILVEDGQFVEYNQPLVVLELNEE